MKLKFIGTGSAFNTKLGNTSAYIKENNTLLLIDCGELTFDRILSLNLLSDVNEVHIAVTHTHPDHIGSLGSFIFYCYFIKKIKPTFHSADNDFIRLLQYMGVTEEHCEFEHNNANPNFSIESLNIRLIYIETDHVKEIQSFGILLVRNLKEKENEEVIYYSGDSCDIKDDTINALKTGQIDLLYQDTCKADYDGNAHLSLRKLVEVIPEELRKNVYIIHTDEGFDFDEARELGFNIAEIEGDGLKIMRRYIVWEFDKHEGWEPHQFDSLEKAEEFKSGLEKVCSNEYVLTKQINSIMDNLKDNRPIFQKGNNLDGFADWWTCPVCRNIVCDPWNGKYSRLDKCENCGQELNWMNY